MKKLFCFCLMAALFGSLAKAADVNVTMTIEGLRDGVLEGDSYVKLTITNYGATDAEGDAGLYVADGETGRLGESRWQHGILVESGKSVDVHYQLGVSYRNLMLWGIFTEGKSEEQTFINTYDRYGREDYWDRDNGILYSNIDESTCYVHSYDGATSSHIDIPETINGRRVVRIGYRAFENLTILQSITLPASITTIDGSAFKGCSNLRSITVAEGLTSIGFGAFSGCSKLESLALPSTLETICSEAFSGCTALLAMTFPAKVSNLGVHIFKDCTSLQTVAVAGDNITFDSRNNCNGIIRTANNELVYGNQHTLIPANIEVIGSYAFYGCTALSSITLPGSLKSIGAYAFARSGIVDINIPEGVKRLDNYAFFQCPSLQSISIPASVTSIAEYPEGGTFILRSCSNLKTIKIANGNSVFDSRNDCNAIIRSAKNQLIAGCSGSTVPDGVVEIAYDAFAGAAGLVSLTIPASVKQISYNAFESCGLQSLHLPNANIQFGSNVFHGCNNLQSIYTENTDPDPINNDVFDSQTYTTATLYVPLGLADVYGVRGGWRQFYGRIAEFDPTGIRSITLPPSSFDVYDLNGRKAGMGTSADGLRKGLYIIDNKKMIIR